MNGRGAVVLRIAPDGHAPPCSEAHMLLKLDFPNVRGHNVRSIWFDSLAVYVHLADKWMPEPCRRCNEKKTDFGGCRCQASIFTGETLNWRQFV